MNSSELLCYCFLFWICKAFATRGEQLYGRIQSAHRLGCIFISQQKTNTSKAVCQGRGENLQTEPDRWLVPWCSSPSRAQRTSRLRQGTKVCPGWFRAWICAGGANGSSSYRPYRSNQDGICRSWCGDGAYHQRYRDLRDACGACRYDRDRGWRDHAASWSSSSWYSTKQKQKSTIS